MANLIKRFSDMKQKVGGNREEFGYEETFGQPMLEQHHITPPPRFLVRIISEVQFALQLSAELGNKYDALIDKSLTILEKSLEEDGVITRRAMEAAEEVLLPMQAEAKEYKVIFAGHAHIDMNWMWSWQETVAATIATFKTMLNIMDEYPQFCFSQSQTSVYKIIDDYAPEMHDRIKARIDEGRWEANACAWVETDKNMPNTESLLRHIKYSKDYLGRNWGIPQDKLEVDFSPDTFGHSYNIPEIDAQGQVKYMYHCRALNGKNALYRWKGASGKELLVFREQFWYNSAITPKPALGVIDISKRCAGLKTSLAVYGVGDHGGGPTRRDIERGMEMQEWPVFPTIKFGTFREYFHEAESVRENLEVVDHELNAIFPGCYTTQSRIKKGNRRAETALSEAENALTMAHLKVGTPVYADAIESAWQKVLFTHFHDILTGSCVQDSREHAMGLYQDALATANSETGLALSKLMDEIDTSSIAVDHDPFSQAEGAGVGYNIDRFAGRAVDERGLGLTRIWNVFNDTFADKAEPVEFTCWDWTGDMRDIEVTDAEGNPLEIQMTSGMQEYWSHKYFTFLVFLKVPALSYTTVVLKQKEKTTYPVYFQPDHRTHTPAANYVLENDHIRAEFNYSTGAMISLKDKESGREMIEPGKSANLEIIDTNRHNSSAWEIGTYLAKHPVEVVENIHTTMGGPLRRGFTWTAHVRGSHLSIHYTLDKDDTFVRANIHADWNEVGGETIPVLAYEMPLAYDTNAFRYNIPAGSIIREAAEADRPGQSYIVALADNKEASAGIIANCKYGFRGIREDGKAHIISTLINTATGPDPYPERGHHDICLAIGVFGFCPSCMERKAHSAHRPMTVLSTSSHKGTLPMQATVLKTECMGGMVSAMYAEENKLFVRMYSVAPKAKTFSVTAPKAFKAAYLCDLFGVKTADVTVEGDKVSAVFNPYEIGTFCFEF